MKRDTRLPKPRSPEIRSRFILVYVNWRGKKMKAKEGHLAGLTRMFRYVRSDRGRIQAKRYFLLLNKTPLVYSVLSRLPRRRICARDWSRGVEVGSVQNSRLTRPPDA